MSVTMGKAFKMTCKTRLFLRLYRIFDRLSQWFITHCDTEEVDLERVTLNLIEDSKWKIIEEKEEVG